MIDMSSFEKGPLWSGVLSSSISKLESSFDVGSKEYFELPNFVALSDRIETHVLVTSLTSVDVSPFIAFASKWDTASSLVIHIPTTAFGRIEPHDIDQVAGVLKSQSMAFNFNIEIVLIDGAKQTFISPITNLSAVIQDDTARQAFLKLPGANEIVAMLDDAECDLLFLHEQVTGSVLGLEVARSQLRKGKPYLEIGVGRNDRMAHQMMDAESNLVLQLQETIDRVRQLRLGQNRFHPLRRLGLAKWMRQSLLDAPGLIGMTSVRAIEVARRKPWPSNSIWNYAKVDGDKTEDDFMYQRFTTSFDDDDVSFALAKDESGKSSVVCTSAGVSLGAPAKTYEVLRALINMGFDVDSALLVLLENNRISSVERMAKLTKYGLSTVSIPSEWQSVDTI